MSDKAPAQRKAGSGAGALSLFDARVSMKRRTASCCSGPSVLTKSSMGRDCSASLLKKQIRRNVKELSQLADVSFAGLALASQYIGRHASGTEDRQQVGLA